MFLTKEELKTVAYSYQVNQITEFDDEIILAAIATGEEEVRGYLSANNRKEYADGRPLYDVDAIFAATGNNRNALILQYTKILALWHLIILCNVDMIYEHVKERYDRVIAFLVKINKGEVTMDLPLLSDTGDTGKQPFRFGSRTKFNHE